MSSHLISSGFRRQGPLSFTRSPGFPYWTAGVLLSGEGTYHSQRRSLRVRAQSIQLIRPGTAYRLERDPAAGAWTEAWAIFAPDTQWVQGLLSLPDSLPGIHSSGIDEHEHGTLIMSTVHDVLRLGRTPGDGARALVSNSIERGLLLVQLGAEDAHHESAVDRRVREAIDMMRQDCAHPWSVAELAASCHVSPSHFAHMFQRQVGTAPLRYLRGLRIERASELLLTTSLSVQVIGRVVGYANPMHFSARFKAATGAAPTRFRTNPAQAVRMFTIRS